MFKCTICNAPAQFMVKGTTTYYCEKHAIEFFGDVAYLVKAESQAQRMQSILSDDTK